MPTYGLEPRVKVYSGVRIGEGHLCFPTVNCSGLIFFVFPNVSQVRPGSSDKHHCL